MEAAFCVRYPSLDKLVEAYTADLSTGGMFLATQRYMPINAVIRLDLVLPEGGGEVAVIARVAFVRNAHEARTSGKPAGMGIEFLDMSGENAKRIEDFIAARRGGGASVAPAAESTTRPSWPLDLVVADDDAPYRELAAAPFVARGDAVRFAADGLEALALCLKQPPDALLSDVQMPKLDGWGLLRMVRARPSLIATPVLFLTTLGGEDDRLRGYRLGVDDYLPKPYAPEELVLRVDRLVSRRESTFRANLEKKSLRGDLEQVSLASILAFLELDRKTGVLLLVSARPARIYLRDGRPLAIELHDAPPDAKPMDLVIEVMGWLTGMFEFAALDVNCTDVLNTSTSALLLECARRADEAKR